MVICARWERLGVIRGELLEEVEQVNRKGNKTRVNPLKNDTDVKAMAAYLKKTDAERGQAAFIVWVLCVNGGLRVSDALELRIASVCGQGKKVKPELTIAEKKTGKLRLIPLGENVRRELQGYIDGLRWKDGIKYQSYLFPSSRKKGQHVSYQWMYNRVKEAAAACGLGENIATHVMRKTFARMWYENNLERYGGSVTACATALQENVLHHAKLSISLRYIDAEEEYARETYKGIDITT